jgi:Zn-dependent protease with chaperone function
MDANFFARQDRARTNTTLLVGLFLVAVIGIVVSTSAVSYIALEFAGSESDYTKSVESWQVALVVALATLLTVVLGTLYKVVRLRSGGGSLVAESLGGTRIYPSTGDLDQQRLMNVVEEMAIASGTPVPSVYLLEDEDAINAFAAGYTPGDAVIGVTRGTVQRLTRDELQGVIAHEFSHVLNGDMRMGIRLIGILHGILLLGLIGRMLFHVFVRSGSSRRGRSNGKGGGGQLVILLIVTGVALMIIGAFGSFIGSLIKAAVSRQREYLADASAVQFTRNPNGLAGALKQIGATAKGSQLKAESATEASHLFFAEGISSGFASWLASHPPLPKRILAIDPGWDGKFPAATSATTWKLKEAATSPSRSQFAGTSAFAAADSQRSTTARRSGSQPIDDQHHPHAEFLFAPQILAAVNQTGAPTQSHRQRAADLIARIPTALQEAAHDPFASRALTFAMLLDAKPAIREKQMTAIRTHMEPPVVTSTERLAESISTLDVGLRLPLIDMAMPALRAMSDRQFQAFDTALQALIDADRQIDVFEWTLSQIVLRHLRPNFRAVPVARIRYRRISQVSAAIERLLSTVAHIGHGRSEATAAFDAGAATLGRITINCLPPERCNLQLLEHDLRRLAQASFQIRGMVINAGTATICFDGKIRPSEAELLRGIADLIDCPIPPILPNAPA